jgi:hypothetical protein
MWSLEESCSSLAITQLRYRISQLTTLKSTPRLV